MIKLKAYGYREEMRLIGSPELIPARITAAHKGRYELITEYGETQAVLKSSVFYGEEKTSFPTTGDFVEIKYSGAGESIIVNILPRKTCFERLDPSSSGHYSQAAAANFDYVFILTSLNHDLNFNRLERYLTAAWQSGGVPVIVLTKSDLNSDYKKMVRETENKVKGVCVFACSSLSGEGFSEMRDFLKPEKTIVLLGSSGVGKSSFINTLASKEIMSVSQIREDDSKGRHTTTHRRLIMLPSGVMIIDTPGIRSLGVWEVDDGLNTVFDEAERLSKSCRFSNCTHTGEPGCAVKNAIQSGELSNEHWNNYKKLKKEANFSKRKEDFRQRKRGEKYKRSAKAMDFSS